MAFGRKKKLLSDLSEMVDFSREACAKHQNEIDDMHRFVDNIILLVKSECPEFLDRFEALMAIMREALAQQQLLQKAELRLAEDLNDVAARFDIVYRISEETVSCKMKLKEVTERIEMLKKKLDEDELKGGFKKVSLQSQISLAIDEKKRTIATTEEKLLQFIDIKERYTAFKIRRMRHGYISYGEGLSNTMQEEIKIWERFNHECRKLYDSVDQIMDEKLKPQQEVEEEKASEPTEETVEE